jgi:acetyltransferase-like isoleucine patch superfamily enzyme
MILRRILFAVLDFLIPDHPRFSLLRGGMAKAVLRYRTATGLSLERGVDFGLRPMLITIGPNCRIETRTHFNVWNALVTIGEGSFIGREAIFYSTFDAPITLGKNVFISARSMIWTGSHEIGDEKQRAGPGTGKPISIGDGVWIGLGCIIRADVGSGCIVNMGSLVTKPVQANILVQGVPAKIVRELPVVASAPNNFGGQHD